MNVLLEEKYFMKDFPKNVNKHLIMDSGEKCLIYHVYNKEISSKFWINVQQFSHMKEN